MRLRDLMKDHVHVVRPHDTVLEARRLMEAHDIRHLPVLDGKHLVGVVSDLDLKGALDHQRVEEVMSAPAATLSPHETTRDAANLMRGRKIGCTPIVDEGKLVGIVTTTDLLALVGRTPSPTQVGRSRKDHGSPAVTQARSRKPRSLER